MWNVAKAMITENFITVKAYIRKVERAEINSLSFYLRKLEKGEQFKTKVSRRTKIRLELLDTEKINK